MGTHRGTTCLLVIATVVMLLFTGCAGESSGGHSTSGSISVALVTPEKAGDNGPTDQMLAGLAKAKSEFGLQTRHIEATDPSTFESTLTNLGNAGVDVVIVAFTQFADAVASVAPRFPKTKWIHLYADPYKPEMNNVQSVAYDTNGPAYLAGVLAAASTQTHAIGFIGGTAEPQVNADYHAFVAGAQATDPKVTVTGVVVGSWTDQVRGQQVGQTVLSRGIDYVLAYAGGASLGVVKAARQAGATVVYDGLVSDAVADVVSATATQEFGTTVYNELQAVVKNDWKPGHVVSGLADGGTVLRRSPEFATKGSPQAVAILDRAFPAVQAAQSKLIDGTIHVPFDTNGF
jgi:basic membrane protein A